MKEIENNGIKIQLGTVEVVDVYTNKFEGDREASSAHLSQERTVIYPASNLGTGFGKGLFESPEGEKHSQTRHSLVAIPVGIDVEKVVEKLKDFEESCLYRIVSNNIEDVIGEKVKAAIAQGLTDLETQKARFIVRDAEGNVYATVTKDGEQLGENDRAIGKVVMEDNKAIGLDIVNEEAVLEYSTIVYSREYTPDQDLREYKPVRANNITQQEQEADSNITA